MTREEFIKLAKENPDWVKATLQEAELKQPVIEALKESGDLMFKPDYEGLVRNKEMLLGEKKDLQTKFEAMNQEKENLKKELDKLQNEIKNNGKDSDNPEIAVLKSQIESLEGKLSESEQVKTQLIGEINNSYIDSHIGQQLDELRIKPSAKEFIHHFFKSKAELKESDGKKYLLIDGKQAPDYFKEFAQSDTAKEYMLAANHSGGGAGGGSSATTGESFDMQSHISGLTKQ